MATVQVPRRTRSAVAASTKRRPVRKQRPPLAGVADTAAAGAEWWNQNIVDSPVPAPYSGKNPIDPSLMLEAPETQADVGEEVLFGIAAGPGGRLVGKTLQPVLKAVLDSKTGQEAKNIVIQAGISLDDGLELMEALEDLVRNKLKMAPKHGPMFVPGERRAAVREAEAFVDDDID